MPYTIKMRALFILLTFTTLYSCVNSSEANQIQQFQKDSISNFLSEKFKGMNYTGPRTGPLGIEPFSSMKEIGTNIVALVPEASLYQNNLKIVHDFEGQWYGETSVAILEGIQHAKEVGLKIMLKPHLEPGLDTSDWDIPEFNFADADSLSIVEHSKILNEFYSKMEIKVRKHTNWRGDLMTKNDADWLLLANAYEQYILDYAVMADSINADAFCIGTELKAMALEKPDYWRSLIKKIRKIYKGPITYAANWDSFDQITFWDDLDFIGIDAYFPLSDDKTPQVKELLVQWQPIKDRIVRLQRKVGKPIVFTEWGYESEDYAGKTPWGSKGEVNIETQINLYESTFQSFWHEPWFLGVFIWRWSPQNELSGTYNFTPKGKQTETVIKEWFNKD